MRTFTCKRYECSNVYICCIILYRSVHVFSASMLNVNYCFIIVISAKRWPPCLPDNFWNKRIQNCRYLYHQAWRFLVRLFMDSLFWVRQMQLIIHIVIILILFLKTIEIFLRSWLWALLRLYYYSYQVRWAELWKETLLTKINWFNWPECPMSDGYLCIKHALCLHILLGWKTTSKTTTRTSSVSVLIVIRVFWKRSCTY